MRPDEAFGLVFLWDNVVANTRELQRQAWRAVGEAEGLPFPAMERPQLYDLRPERAVTDVLMWTRDWKRAQELAWLVATQYAALLMELGQPIDGVTDWLQVGAGGHRATGVTPRRAAAACCPRPHAPPDPCARPPHRSHALPCHRCSTACPTAADEQDAGAVRAGDDHGPPHH